MKGCMLRGHHGFSRAYILLYRNIARVALCKLEFKTDSGGDLIDVFLGSAVVPIALAITWKKVSAGVCAFYDRSILTSTR
jgi:hypothetical protein